MTAPALARCSFASAPGGTGSCTGAARQCKRQPAALGGSAAQRSVPCQVLLGSPPAPPPLPAAPLQAFGFVAAPHNWVSRKDEADKIIVVEKGGLAPLSPSLQTKMLIYKENGAEKGASRRCRSWVGLLVSLFVLPLPSPPPVRVLHGW